MSQAESQFLGFVYVWRIKGQAYYAESRDAAPLDAERAKRFLVVDGDRPYEVISIDRGGSGEYIRDAVRVE